MSGCDFAPSKLAVFSHRQAIFVCRYNGQVISYNPENTVIELTDDVKRAFINNDNKCSPIKNACKPIDGAL